MRKLLLSLTALLVIGATANAQASLGVKAGANFANLKASGLGTSISFENKIGAYGGVFLTSPLAGGIALQPELVYSMEGAKFGDDKLKLTYVNLPVMLQYHAAGLVVEAGPQLGYLLSAKENDDDVKEDFKKINLSLGIGAGYRFPVGLGINARYNLGLSNIAEDIDEGSVKTNVFQVGLTLQTGRSGASMSR